MTGAREAGVLHGQARARELRKKSHEDRDVLALERIAEALESLDVSLAVLADLTEMSVYADDLDGEGADS